MTDPNRYDYDPTGLLTLRDASARYGVHVQTLRKWVRDQVVPYVRVGPYGTIRFRPADLERLVEIGVRRSGD